MHQSDSSVFTALKSFEVAELVHTLYDPTIELYDPTIVKFERTPTVHVFELPRFDLSFELRADGKMHSRNFRGFFFMSNCQQLPDALHNFEQYLVLNDDHGAIKVIIPGGTVTCRAGSIVIAGQQASDAKRAQHAYDVHPRFRTLEAPNIEARLQLAALYAATGSELPEARSQRAGGEVALALLRQCWVDRPFTSAEHEQLRCVMKFDQLTPALALLGSELDLSARRLDFLRPETADNAGENPHLPVDKRAAAEYRLRKQASQLNHAALLSHDEEQYSSSTAVHRQMKRGCSPIKCTLDVPSFATKGTRCSVESELAGMLLNQTTSSSVPEFPLPGIGGSRLGTMMTQDLKASWEAHHQLETPKLSKNMQQCHTHGVGSSLRFITVYQDGDTPHDVRRVVGEEVGCWRLDNDRIAKKHTEDISWVWANNPHENILTRLRRLAEAVTDERQAIEQHLIKFLSLVPSDAEVRTVGFRLRRTANLVSSVTLSDLAVCAIDCNKLRRFNSFLSDAALGVIHVDILEWLQLCVMEDKLERMQYCAEKPQELQRELQVTREWSVCEYPQWLVFEVEQRLQIRNVQYEVAKSLMNKTTKTGAITQLNMGEGKTRVILPMLILSLATTERLIRLHFLYQLMDEAFEYLHRHLTASLMNRRLCQLPFHRDVKLTEVNVFTMHRCLKRCRTVGGVLCVTPEHRPSLLLKRHDLKLQAASESAEERQVVDALPKLDELPYCDVR
eukprot:SAG11_NODE_331_length_10659_cov_4.512689_3_plen_733_part_00